MILKLSNAPIDNPRNYPLEIVEELQEALEAGVAANPDPSREGFYDLEAESRTYFVAVTPKGTVTLLAIWAEELVPA
jgi:hypothetical protein